MNIEAKKYQYVSTAITKAVNHNETPVKEKHARSIIIGTFHENGAKTFWNVGLRLPLQDDRIVAWKFCHVLHKLLREGHAATIEDSQHHRADLEDMGKLWVHLRDCYGKLIRLYCTLLIAKLDFHRRNPRFPGNLSVTHSELENIGENDINNYFQMSVEMFDYMDSILELQAAIFGSIDRSRSNSMTSSGQCRLSPLIPCIQDASRLYDFCVKLLFKLHSQLPPDTLSGHRERFLKQFKELKSFYQNSHNLQYFRNLITIPSLPENPPNFLVQSELRTYVPPEVIIPPEEPETESLVEGTLIDTSHDSTPDIADSANQNGGTPPSTHFLEIIAERDNLIAHLQNEYKILRLDLHRRENANQKEIKTLREQITAEITKRESELEQERQIKEDNSTSTSTHFLGIIAERDNLIAYLQNEYKILRSDLHRREMAHQKDVQSLQEQITAANTEIATRQSELEQERQIKQDLFQQATNAAQSLDSEQKEQVMKLEKLKDVYFKLRDEHIQLIKQKAEVDMKLIEVNKSLLLGK